jgi:glycosyltransferase involved in cell wall biosynthesis
MRIVYLNPCAQMGGAETSLIELLASIRAAQPKWELTVVLGEAGPLVRKAEALGVDVKVAPLPPALARIGDTDRRLAAALGSSLLACGAVIRYAGWLARILRALRPEIVHTNGFKMHLMGSWARPAGAQVVWHVHDYVRPRRMMSRLLRWNRRRCTTVIANSESVAADVRDLLPALPVVAIYNAVDLKRFAPSGPRVDLDALSDLRPAAPGTRRVGLVGTFARWKGHAVFLRALSLLPPEALVRGYVIGGPIYRTKGSQWSVAELRQKADGLGLRGRVGFTGFVEDAATAIRSLDVVVHASTRPEPFGMVIIEGMACGKAVIASLAGGASELLEDGANAVGHPPGNADALARLILRLAGDDLLRSRLGQAGRGTAERLFHRGRLARQSIALYHQVLGYDGEVLEKADRVAAALY